MRIFGIIPPFFAFCVILYKTYCFFMYKIVICILDKCV